MKARLNNINFTKENIWYYGFILALLLDAIVNCITSFLSSYSDKYLSVLSFFKIPAVLEVAIAVIFLLLIKKNIKLNFLSKIFLIFMVLGILVGAFSFQLNSKFVVHIYIYGMPIIMMTFANCFYKDFVKNTVLQELFYKMIIVSSWIYIIVAVLFRALSMFVPVRYAAFGAGTGIYNIPFFSVESSVGAILFGYITAFACMLSGKRLTLVIAVFTIGVSWFMFKRKKKALLSHVILCALALVAVVFLAMTTNVFDRIWSTISAFFGENANWYVATGGRDYEIQCIAVYLSEKPWKWIFGAGFGVQVWIKEIYRHYSHFTPLGYVLISGVFCSCAIYGVLLWNAMKGFALGLKGRLKKIEKPFIVLLIIAIVVSLFGASLFSTPIWWFYIGIALGILEENHKCI